MRALKINTSVFDRWKTRTKMMVSFLVVVMLTVILGCVSLVTLKQVNQASSELANNWLPSVKHLSSARVFILEFREFEIKHANAADSSYMAEYEEKLTKAAASVDSEIAAYKQKEIDAQEMALLEALQKSWREYGQTNKKIVALSHDNKPQDARDISDGAGKDSFETALAQLDKLSAFSFEQGRKAAEVADQTHGRARTAVLGVVALSVVVGLAMAVFITNKLLRQLGGEPAQAVQLVKAVASGNLTTRIDVKSGDQTSLMACLKEMQSSLANVVASVRESSENVATASYEISQGNNDLSARTELQAGALQQTTSSMEDLGTTVTQNAENARQANLLASEASSVAQQGGAAVHEVVDTMRDINESSRRIADITGVIDSIAFQTNILALNAAVEAARAGEQGRGFAVVASEVRSLAQRSATAAKEIKSLIAASVEQVQQGSAQVDRAGTTMDQVVKAIQRVTEIVNEISAASSQQSDGVHLVGNAIAQIDQTTQQNAALVEQSAAAAESLKSQARQLVEAVAVFKT